MATVQQQREAAISGDNAALVERARRVIPGGVNSANRVLPWPFAVTAAAGAYITDADGRDYLDYHAAFGPLILGHNHPRVNAAVHAAMGRLDIVGVGVTDIEVELAETIARHVPSAERVLLTNSGSEATYAALRLARAATGRTKIIKFQGTYHGWHDAVLMNVISAPEQDRPHRPRLARHAAGGRREHHRAAVQRYRAADRDPGPARRGDRGGAGRGDPAQHRLRAAPTRSSSPRLRD